MDIENTVKQKPFFRFLIYMVVSFLLVACLGLAGLVITAVLSAVFIYIKKPVLDIKRPFPGGVVVGVVLAIICWLSFGTLFHLPW